REWPSNLPRLGAKTVFARRNSGAEKLRKSPLRVALEGARPVSREKAVEQRCATRGDAAPNRECGCFEYAETPRQLTEHKSDRARRSFGAATSGDYRGRTLRKSGSRDPGR